jgi:hypothetical protein
LDFFLRVTSYHSSSTCWRVGGARRAASMKEERGARPSQPSSPATEGRASRGALPLPLDDGGRSELSDDEEEGLYSNQEGISSPAWEELAPAKWKGVALGLRPSVGVVAAGAEGTWLVGGLEGGGRGVGSDHLEFYHYKVNIFEAVF